MSKKRKNRIKCLSDNRKIIKNTKCKNNLDEVYGAQPHENSVIIGDLTIPAGSIIRFNKHGNTPRSAKLSEDVTYRDYTFKKDSRIGLRSITKKNPKAFIVSSASFNTNFTN